MCPSLCISVCVSGRASVCVCECFCLSLCVSLCLSMLGRVCFHVPLFLSLCMSLCVCVCLCLGVFVCVFVFVCMPEITAKGGTESLQSGDDCHETQRENEKWAETGGSRGPPRWQRECQAPGIWWHLCKNTGISWGLGMWVDVASQVSIAERPQITGPPVSRLAPGLWCVISILQLRRLSLTARTFMGLKRNTNGWASRGLRVAGPGLKILTHRARKSPLFQLAGCPSAEKVSCWCSFIFNTWLTPANLFLKKIFSFIYQSTLTKSIATSGTLMRTHSQSSM